MILDINPIIGGTDAFNALIYPEQNIANISYVDNQFMNINNIMNPISDIGQNFINKTKQLYEAAKSSDAIRIARMAIEQVKSLVKPNVITSLNSIVEIQTAQDAMQKWIMAYPPLKQLHNEQRIYGYSETYNDVSPGEVGNNDYNYRRVMNGVLQVTEDMVIIEHYIEELLEGDRELRHDEQVDILSTWDCIEYFMQSSNIDPTDPWGGEINV